MFVSNHLEYVVSQLSQEIALAIHPSHPQCKLLPYILSNLTRMEDHPSCLVEGAYKWCSLICENYQNLADGPNLLFLSLEIGFRHLHPEGSWVMDPLTHTEHHHKLAGIIFESGDNKAIADLLLAWTLGYNPSSSDWPLNACAGHITLLLKLQPFSSRFRQVIIYSIEAIGYGGFKEVGVVAFVALLNNLCVCAKDMRSEERWIGLILGVIQSSEVTQHLSHHYWCLLVELVILWSQWLEPHPTYDPQVMTSLKDAQEWDKLECWMGVVWIVWPPDGDEAMEKDLECWMVLLFHQQPDAIQRLQQWMEQWGKKSKLSVPESFRRICEEAQLKTTQQGTL